MSKQTEARTSFFLREEKPAEVKRLHFNLRLGSGGNPSVFVSEQIWFRPCTYLVSTRWYTTLLPLLTVLFGINQRSCPVFIMQLVWRLLHPSKQTYNWSQVNFIDLDGKHDSLSYLSRQTLKFLNMTLIVYGLSFCVQLRCARRAGATQCRECRLLTPWPPALLNFSSSLAYPLLSNSFIWRGDGAQGGDLCLRTKSIP